MIKESAVKDGLVSQIDFLDVMASITGVSGGQRLSPDGAPIEKNTWLGADDGGRPFAVEMAANHTLSLIMFGWKYVEPKGGPAMVPWGPKIETGYSADPQLYKTVDGELDENNNVAAENPTMVNGLKEELERIRNTRGYYIECR